jgi:outer membrane lipoprotein SlyB
MNTMSAAIASQAPSTSASGLAAVPKAIWLALGALGIATAGLAAALVMHSGDNKAAAPVSAQQASALPKVAPDDGTPPVAKVQPGQPPAQAQARAAKPAPQRAAGHAPAQVAQGSQAGTSHAAICASCGTVESVQAVQQKGEGTGIGVAGGAVAGGLLGHQVGGGNGKTALTVLGAVGGAFAGNEIEKRARATTVYDVQVRMEDGSTRTFRRAEPIAAGTKVQAEGTTLRVSGGAVRTASGG